MIHFSNYLTECLLLITVLKATDTAVALNYDAVCNITQCNFSPAFKITWAAKPTIMNYHAELKCCFQQFSFDYSDFFGV
jgi:hypothetical protein